MTMAWYSKNTSTWKTSNVVDWLISAAISWWTRTTAAIGALWDDTTITWDSTVANWDDIDVSSGEGWYTQNSNTWQTPNS